MAFLDFMINGDGIQVVLTKKKIMFSIPFYQYFERIYIHGFNNTQAPL